MRGAIGKYNSSLLGRALNSSKLGEKPFLLLRPVFIYISVQGCNGVFEEKNNPNLTQKITREDDRMSIYREQKNDPILARFFFVSDCLGQIWTVFALMYFVTPPLSTTVLYFWIVRWQSVLPRVKCLT